MTPNSESDLAEIVASAKRPLAIRGGGTRPIGSPVAGDALSLGGLSGIELYEPGALTLVAKSGTPLAEIEVTLAAEGQRLAFEPMDHRALLGTKGTPTIGGVVAANVSGPRRVQMGACRDYLLGVRFVDGAGRIIKNGGRVMKNVTGYDLVKLMAGSYGTLGVLSEVSLKVLPQVETAASLVIQGLSDARAISALSTALGSPFEVTGAAHTHDENGTPVALIRLEGFENSVTYRSGRLRDLLKTYGEVEIVSDPNTVAAQWQKIRDVEMFKGDPRDIWRLSVKPSDAPGLVARMPLGRDVTYDWGGGLIWAACAPDTDLRTLLGDFAGHATLIRASAATRARIPAFHPEPVPIATITAGLRAKFDPRSILNPGLMG
ncbi:MAG: FAD-binding protein [Marinosulfonomonas sp.]|nr:FAD-binding protein [Marinosulfonomonas sp.]